jgi:hypothetical protein
MGDQNSFDKPDPASNHSNEVYETVRASIKAALAWLPGGRANPGTGAVRRSTPSAGEVLLETSDNAAGSAWSTLFDSRTKLNKAGDTMTSTLVANVAAGGVAFEARSTGGTAYIQWYNGAAAADKKFFRMTNDGTTGLSIESLNDAYSSARQLAIAATGGHWTFPLPANSNSPTISAKGYSGGFGAAFLADGGGNNNASYACYMPAAAADNRYWDHGTFSSGTSWQLRAVNDANSVAVTAISADRTGTTIDRVNVHTNFRLKAAAPKIEHETGGQVVASTAYFAASGRGNVQLSTYDTAGVNPRLGFSISGSGTDIAYSAGGAAGGAVNCGSSELIFKIADAQKWLLNSSMLAPWTDNSVTLGASGFRPSALWAVNGTIQTSDLTDKLAISPIDADLATRFVLGLRPITYRWAVGGNKVEQVPDGFDEREYDAEEEYDEVVDEPVTEAVEVQATEQRIEIVEGRAVVRNVSVTRVEQRPVGTWHPMFDEASAPVLRQTGTRKRHVGRGILRREVEEPVFEQAQHFVQATRKATVKARRTVKRIEQVPRFKSVVTPVPGKRTHAGFGAQDIKALMDYLGIDCGLWVLGEDGKQSLRPDQMIPFLAAALGRALERIDALERRG